MSWQIIARKDFDDAVRSKLVWATVGMFSLFVLMFVFIEWSAGGAAYLAVATLVGPAEILVPVVALVAGYLSIAGERESGSLRIMLGFPHSRTDFMLGKLVGRSMVITAGTLAAFILATLVIVAFYATLPLADLLWWLISTTVLGIAFIGIAVGISATASSRIRSMVGSLGIFFVFHLFWQPIIDILHVVIEGDLPAGGELPAWFVFARRLSPMIAYQRIADWGLIANVESGFIKSSAEASANPNLVARVPGETPVYLTDGFTIVILALWVAIPLLIGYVRFQSADLR